MKVSTFVGGAMVGLIALAWHAECQAVLGISQLSAPLEYATNNWYAYAKFGESASWDEADALVAALPHHNGLLPILATFPTSNQYIWFVNHITNFSNPSIGNWDIGWIGATNAGGGIYAWAVTGGTIATNAPQWDHTYAPQPQPGPTNYAAAQLLGEYGNVWATYPVAEEFGNAIVQYVVPEPATLLIALGGLLAVTLRRACRRA